MQRREKSPSSSNHLEPSRRSLLIRMEQAKTPTRKVTQTVRKAMQILLRSCRMREKKLRRLQEVQLRNQTLHREASDPNSSLSPLRHFAHFGGPAKQPMSYS